MADEIVNALSGLLSVAQQATGIRRTYDYPDSRPAADASEVFLMAVPVDGSWQPESAGEVKGLHNFQLGAYVARKEGELAKAIEKTLPVGDLLKDKLLSSAIANIQWQDSDGNATIDAPAAEITYSYGPLNYADLNLFGWTLTFPAKIRSRETSTGVYAIANS